MTTATRNETLEALGIGPTSRGASTGSWLDTRGPEIVSFNPSNGEPLGRVLQAEAADYDAVVRVASESFTTWRLVPAPRRGEVVRHWAKSYGRTRRRWEGSSRSRPERSSRRAWARFRR